MKTNNMIREKAQTSDLYTAIDYTIYNIIEGTPANEEFNTSDEAIEAAAKEAIEVMEITDSVDAGLINEVLKHKSLIIKAIEEWKENN